MKKGKNLSVNAVKLNDFLRDYKAYCANEEAITIDYGNAPRDILNGFLFGIAEKSISEPGKY